MPVTSTSRYAGVPVYDAPDAQGNLHPCIAIRPLPTPPTAVYQRSIAALDTLETLSWTCFQSSTLWWRIADTNPLVYPFDWRPGDTVSLPSPVSNGTIVRTRKF